MSNYIQFRSLLSQYGVKTNLSGHSYLQHTSIRDGFTDICREALPLYPTSYAEIKFTKTMDYKTHSLGI